MPSPTLAVTAASRNDSDYVASLLHRIAVLEERNRVLATRVQALVEESVARPAYDVSALQAAARERDALQRAKNDFLVMLSHELRTPLNSIIGFSDLLRDELGSMPRPEMVEWAQTIGLCGNELLHKIEDLIQIALISANEVKVRTRATRVGDLLRVIEEKSKQLAAANNNTVVIRSSVSTPVGVDAWHVDKILEKLMSNACKFTRYGTITCDVELHRRGGGAFLECAVMDTGIGMSPELQASLFRKFEQGDNSGTRPYGGMGTGLYIAQNLARVLGGEITVSSKLGCGSTFVLRVPCTTL